MVFICLLVAAINCYAQQIIWEKQFGWVGIDQITAICQANDGAYFGVGIVDKFGTNNAFGSAIIKFDSNGDTLFVKKLNFYCQTWGLPYIGKSWNGNYLVVINVQMEISPFQFARFPAIVEINEEGSVIQAKLFPQHEFCIITGVKASPDLGLMLSGYKSSLDVFHTDSMFAMKVNFLLEQEWAFKYTNIANAPFRGQHLEPMENKNYLVSGALGKRVYGMELDSNGTLLNEKIYYQTPSNRIFNEAKLYQGFGNNSTFSQGYYLDGSNNTVGYFGRVNNQGQKIWGGESPGRPGPMYLNREQTLIHTGTEGQTKFISRIRADSSLIWKLNLGDLSETRKILFDLCFTTPDTGIVVGTFIDEGNNLSFQFWIAKIAGVGTQYNPATPWDTIVSVEERIFRPKDAPVLYPNPAKESIQFTKLSEKARFSLYSLKGEKRMEKDVLPKEAIDICQLPKGVYLYHLRMGERVFTGKLVKKE